MSKVNLAYLDEKTGGKKSIQVFARSRRYFLVTEGLWEMVIADESKEFKAGEAKRIRIKPLRLDIEKIVMPDLNIRHPYGCLLSLGTSGEPRKVEEVRSLNQAIFLAVDDGVVQENELIGVVNIFNTVVYPSLLANLLLQIRAKIARSPKAYKTHIQPKH